MSGLVFHSGKVLGQFYHSMFTVVGAGNSSFSKYNRYASRVILKGPLPNYF